MSDCSSQKMTLDDAIAHLDDMITGAGLREGCLHEHEKLRGWLAELKNLMERYERLAQVAREMFHEYREFMKDYLWDNGASSSATKQRRLIVMFHDRLEECGVSVDDRT